MVRTCSLNKQSLSLNLGNCRSILVLYDKANWCYIYIVAVCTFAGGCSIKARQRANLVKESFFYCSLNFQVRLYTSGGLGSIITAMK